MKTVPLPPVETRADDLLAVRVSSRRRDRRRVIVGLVDDEIRDDPRLRVEYKAARLLIRRRIPDRQRSGAIEVDADRLGRLEYRGGQAWEDVVGGAELTLAQHEIVETPIDRSQTVRHLYVRKQGKEIRPGCMLLRDQDLLENEFQVGPYQRDHVPLPSLVRLRLKAPLHSVGCRAGKTFAEPDSFP
jgi:hypothetical protein